MTRSADETVDAWRCFLDALPAHARRHAPRDRDSIVTVAALARQGLNPTDLAQQVSERRHGLVLTPARIAWRIQQAATTHTPAQPRPPEANT